MGEGEARQREEGAEDWVTIPGKGALAFFASVACITLFRKGLWVTPFLSFRMALRFGTLNANGLREDHRLAMLAPYADLHALDILFVQETHWLPDTGAARVALALGARGFQSDGPGRSSGVAIFIRDRCQFVVRSSWGGLRREAGCG